MPTQSSRTSSCPERGTKQRPNDPDHRLRAGVHSSKDGGSRRGLETAQRGEMLIGEETVRGGPRRCTKAGALGIGSRVPGLIP